MDFGFSKWRNLVNTQPIGTCSVNGPSPMASEFLEDPGVGREQGGIEDPGKLELWSGGIEKWANDVENTGLALLREELANGNDGLESGVAGGCEKETATSSFERDCGAIGREIDVHAEGFEHIGSARFRSDASVAVFHDRSPGACGDKHDSGRDIEKSGPVPACAADIESGFSGERKLHSVAKQNLDEAGNLRRCFPSTVEG